MTPAGLLRPVTPGSPDTPRGRLAARKMPGERRGELSRSYRRISVRVECSCVQKRTQTSCLPSTASAIDQGDAAAPVERHPE